MNIASKKFLLIFASAAFLVAGCTKKPKRPDPSATLLGPDTGGSSLNATPVDAAADASAQGLVQRDPNIIETDDMIKGMFQPVYFDFDRFNIKESERSKLQEASKYFQEHTNQRILLEGHCDWRGTDEYNLSLGDRRANAAKKYLATLSSPEKIETLSKGSLDASKDADDAARAKQRRVEIIILKK